MVVERNTFHLHFGKAREGIAIWKEIISAARTSKDIPRMRLLTDLSGTFYTIILEIQLINLNEIGLKNYQWMTNDRFKELYQKFIGLCKEGTREYYFIEDEIAT